MSNKRNRETAASENATSYFPLLDRIAAGTFANIDTDAGLYEKFISILSEDGHVTNAASLSTFNLALALRSAAPRVEAHYQYYDTQLGKADVGQSCDIWIAYGGNQYCSLPLDSAHSAESFSHS